MIYHHQQDCKPAHRIEHTDSRRAWGGAGHSNEYKLPNVSLSFYVHIPYCVKRCGYCDFNTYTPGELKKGSDSVATVAQGYVDALLGEIERAEQRLGEEEISTIFFGGGTPTLLPAEHLGRVIDKLESTFGLAKDCEITTEANPDSVDDAALGKLREVGFNRISFGVQSVKSHVLQVLDRTHDSTRVGAVVTAARKAGFDSLSIDLIYGTPGESLEDFQESVDFALSLPIDHVSAYALIVEQGTKFGAAVRRGEITMPNDDETAEKYLFLDEYLERAGFTWYELSNWSKPGHECRHNRAYWLSANWWGLGAGAHSHVDGERWWNLKHPATYIDAVNAGNSPTAGHEILELADKKMEELLLRIRMREGMSLDTFSTEQRARLDGFRARELFLAESWEQGQVVLSISGRLLADQIVRELIF